MAKIGSLTADLKLESAAFIRDMRRAAQETARSTSQMQRSMAGIGKSFSAGAALKTFVAGFIGLKSIQGLAAIVGIADEIGDTAARLGVGAEELQRFHFAGEQAGVAITEMDNALKVFQKNLAAGKIGAEGGTIVEKFADVIKQIQNAPTQMKEIEIATAAAGKQFGSLLAIARMGPEEFKKWHDSAAVFSKDALKAADDLDKAWRAFSNSLLVPFGTGFLEGLTGGIDLTEKEIKELQETAIGVGRAIGEAIRIFVRDIRGFIDLGKRVMNAFTPKTPAKPQQIRGALTPEALGVLPEVKLVNPEIPELKVSELEKPLGEAAKSAKEIADAAEAARHEWEVGTDVLVNELTPQMKELHETLQNVGEMAASAFADAVVEGKNFQEVIDQLLKSIAKMVIELLLAKAIKMSIDSAFSAATGVPTSNFHAGGIVGRDGRGGRNLPSSMFLNAPRFHGGMMPGEFPAVLKKGEGVFTPEQMKALGGGTVNNFTVINQAPNTKVTEERRDDPSGGQDDRHHPADHDEGGKRSGVERASVDEVHLRSIAGGR